MTQALATVAEYTPSQIAIIKQSIAKGVTDDELRHFMQVCYHTGLDPFAKEIYAIVRRDHGTPKMVIQTGIDGYRKVAGRSQVYAGKSETTFDCCEHGDCEGRPNRASVTVYKIVAGVRCPFPATGAWREFAPSANINDPTMSMWRKMPHLMLGKCVEAQALRMAAFIPAGIEFQPDTIEGTARAVIVNDEPVNAQTGELLAPMVVDIPPARIAAPAPMTPAATIDPAWRCPDHKGRTPKDGRCTMTIGPGKQCPRTAWDAQEPAVEPTPVDYLKEIGDLAADVFQDPPEELSAWLAARDLTDGTEAALLALKAFAAGFTEPDDEDAAQPGLAF